MIYLEYYNFFSDAEENLENNFLFLSS